MISTVSLLGQAGDQIEGFPEFRIVHIESREAFNEESFFSKIPVMYWDRSTSNPLTKVPKGHFVCIFGRIEHCPELGLYVLASELRHFPSNLKEHNKDQ